MDVKLRGTTTIAGLILAITATTSIGGHNAVSAGGSPPLGRGTSKPVAVPYFSDEPGDPPVVLPIVTCIRRLSGDVLEAVFGYRNTANLSVVAPLDGLSNTVTGGLSGGQARPTQLLPGRHPHTFSVRYRADSPPTWTFLSPDSVDVNHPAMWIVSITPTGAPPCNRHVPTRFANVQWAQTGFGFANIRRKNDGDTSYITAYDVQLAPTTIRVGCTGDGDGRLDDVLYGWGLSSNVGPVDDDHAIEVLRGTNTFLVTTDNDRPVIDAGAEVTMSEMSNDISASCVYSHGPVVSAPVFYEDRIGELFTIAQLQFADGSWHLIPGIIAPGGIRFR